MVETSIATRRRRVNGLQAAVSLLSLGAVVWWAMQQERPELPRGAGAIAALAAALAVYTVGTLARGERWHQIVRRGGVRADRADSFRLTIVGYMGNNTLPARGGDLMRAFLLSARTDASRRSALGTVVAERLLDALALAAMFVAVPYALLRHAVVPSGRWLLFAAGALAALTLALVALVVLAGRLDAAERVRAFLRPLATATRNLVSAHGLALLALSLVIWALEAAVYFAVGRAVNLDLDPLGAVYVVTLTNLCALVPAAPGYIGTFDAAVLFAVHSLAGTGAEAISYLLLLRFVLFVPITLVGFVFFVTRYGGWSRYRAARSAST